MIAKLAKTGTSRLSQKDRFFQLLGRLGVLAAIHVEQSERAIAQGLESVGIQFVRTVYSKHFLERFAGVGDTPQLHQKESVLVVHEVAGQKRRLKAECLLIGRQRLLVCPLQIES